MTVNVYTYEDGSKYMTELSSVREPNASGLHTGSSFGFSSQGLFGRPSLRIKNEEVCIDVTHTSMEKLVYAAIADPKTRRFIIDYLVTNHDNRKILKKLIAKKDEQYEYYNTPPTMETAQ